jgi:hypothetical protein
MGENIIGINGKDYLIVNRKPETGDLIFCNDMIGEFRYTDGGYNIVNYGGSADGKDAWYVDDCQVLVPLKTVGITQASRDIHDLLANLARRVSSLEQQLSATQGNVEKLAEELAGNNNVARKALTATGNHGGWLIRNAERFDKIEELLESNEQDIAMLDERTQPKETTTPPLLFVQNSVGNNFTLYQEGKKVHGIRSVRINASYDDVTTHEVEYVTGATDGGVRR